MGHMGIALATSISLYYNMIMLNRYIGKEMSGLIDEKFRFFTKPENIQSIISGMILTVFFLKGEIFTLISGNAFILLSLKTAATAIVFGVLFFLMKRKK